MSIAAEGPILLIGAGRMGSALLKGWRSRFLRDLSVPGELPETVTAWRDQQFRWTKGFAQCARKLMPSIWGTPDLPLSHKVA